MKCLVCEKWSFLIICKYCQKTLLKPSFYKREIQKDFFNYSFYTFLELENLLLSKYYFYGDRVLNILAKLSFEKFAKNFKYEANILAIPIDDHTRHSFSHTAILARYLDSPNINVKYNKKKKKNKIKYAGHDLKYRRQNKRNFKIKKIKKQSIILVDDLITTGTTILEAKKSLETNNNEVLFSLTLADAKIY